MAPPTGVRPMKMTEARRNAFLTALRVSGGCFTAACAAASPKSTAKRVKGYTTFRDLMKRDLGFAAEVDAVMQQCAEDIEAELHRRSMTGILEPVFQAGKRVLDFDGTPASVRKFSDQILLRRAAALLPDRYGDRKTLDVVHSGAIQHVPLTMQDLQGLSPAELAKVEEAFSILQRAQSGGGQPALEHKPEAQVIDAEYETVKPEPMHAWEGLD